MEFLKNKYLWIGIAVGIAAYYIYCNYVANQDATNAPVPPVTVAN